MEKDNIEEALGRWSDLKPQFWRQVRALFRKQFVIKWRHAASIVEFLIALVIYLVLLPIDALARKKYGEVKDPELTQFTGLPTGLFAFWQMSERITMSAAPDTQQVRDLVAATPYLSRMMQGWNLSLPTGDWVYFRPTEIEYTDDVDDMNKKIYSKDSNGIGIYWVNAKSEDALTNPVIEVYQQVDLGMAGQNDLYWEVKQAIAILSGVNLTSPLIHVDPETLRPNMDLKIGMYARPEIEEKFDISIATGMFGILPIILSTMPDLQTIFEEKDSRVALLGFLMGCSETAYWFVSFITPFVLSIWPYLGMCLVLCYWFGMKGTDFTLMLVAALLFIIAHIWFQLWIVTFIKKGSSGRGLTVIMIVFTMFFSYLHAFLTLDENNSSSAMRHVFAIIPFSAYQEFLMGGYKQCSNELDPYTWADLNMDVVCPPWIPLVWLLVDCILYFILFLIFNATNERAFGTPIIRWREMCSKDAWKRVFSSEGSLKVAGESRNFLEVHELKKVFHGNKDVVALHDVEFHVDRGEVIVMIGPNGAGKSTLINVIAGAIEPSEGRLRLFNGPETGRFREIQKYLGVCFQENVIIKLLSVREHFELFGAFRGCPKDQLEKTIDFFANTLQLTEMLDNRAGDLSGGQKRKLCLGLSLLGNPPVVIMDEPTAGVDVQARQLIWKVIATLKDTTTIVTSHALEEAEAVSSRLFIMSGGHIPFAGTSTELRKQFKCGYVLRVDQKDKDISAVVDLVKSFVTDAHVDEARPDCIELPVEPQIGAMLKELSRRKDELGILSYSFAVEQLEDMLLRMIQTDEATIQQNN